MSKDHKSNLKDVAGTVVFFMPRCRHDHVRAVHKQAWTLHSNGYEVVLVVGQAGLDAYLGMRVVTANSPFESILRPLLNLPNWFMQCRRLHADVYFLQNPDTIPLAFLLILTGRRVIYDTHEDFSKRPMIREISPSFLKPIAARLITVFERILARAAAAVIVTQPQQLVSMGGKTFLQLNAPLTEGPIMDSVGVIESRRNPRQLTIIYVGGITEDRGLLKMLDLIVKINDTLSCRLSLVGWFHPDELLRRAIAHDGWKYVDFTGRVTHAESLSRIKDADVALALLAPVADYPTTSITKLFEYMQFGVPFVASDFSPWRVVTDRGAPGLYVNPEDPEACLSACRRLLNDAELRSTMGDAGSYYIQSEFNWNRYAEAFLDIVASACASSRSRSND